MMVLMLIYVVTLIVLFCTGVLVVRGDHDNT